MDFPKTLNKFYWSIIKKFPVYFITMFILSIATYTLDSTMFPYANKWAFQIFEMTDPSYYSGAIKLITLFAVYYFTVWFVGLISDIIEGRIRPSIMRYTNNQLYKRVYNNDTDFFINRPAGQIANKVGEVQNNLMSMTLDFWTDLISIGLALLLISGTLFAMNVWLSLFVLGCSVIRAAWQLIMQRPVNKTGKQLLDVSSNISGIRTDSLGNTMTAKLFAGNDYENNYIYKKQAEEVSLRQKNSFLRRLQNKPGGGIFLAMQVGVVIICWVLIKDGQIAISDAAFAFVGGRTLAMAFTRMTKAFQDYSENRAKAKHAYEDVIQEQKVMDKPGAKNLKVTHAKIDFDNVSFDYGSADVLKNFKLNVAENEKIGVVGLSGAGKTTLVNLILRMYDVKSGAIKIDGQDVRDVKQDSLRRQIAFVPQESVLFNRTLLENIRYAKPSATKADVIAAAKKANIHEFIETLPDKYETLVGNRGIKLSGGQRQRIAIARAILKSAPILILDEATSALDSKSEMLIQEALGKIMRGKTTIAIAHRLSTLRNMDRIIVMDRGKIVESGTHAQLLRKKGLYKKLWSMQTNGFINE